MAVLCGQRRALRSRARCVQLQSPSSVIRGVKAAFAKDRNHRTNRDIVLSTDLQRRENWTYPETTSEPQLTSACPPDRSRTSGSTAFYPPKRPQPRGTKMECEIYQDCGWFRTKTTAVEIHGQTESCEHGVMNSSPDWAEEAYEKAYSNLNMGEDDYSSYLIGKNDTYDDVHGGCKPDDVIPISYTEKMHLLYEDIKEEVVEEEGMVIGREEEVEEGERLYNELWEGKEEKWEGRREKEGKWEERQEGKWEEPQEGKWEEPQEGKLEGQQEATKLQDLGLELENVPLMEEFNTPDFDPTFDLITYINEYIPDVPPPNIDLIKPEPLASLHVPPRPALPTTIPHAATPPLKQKETFVAISRSATSSSTERIPKMVIINQELPTINLDDLNSSIAERIKTGSKRRRRTKYEISEDEEDRDDDDGDKDFRVEEEQPKRKKIRLSLSSESSTKSRRNSDDSRYRELRDKNNEASRRSRQNRKDKESDLFHKLEDEERRNVRLKERADQLEKTVNFHRQMLLQVFVKTGARLP